MGDPNETETTETVDTGLQSLTIDTITLSSTESGVVRVRKISPMTVYKGDTLRLNYRLVIQ